MGNKLDATRISLEKGFTGVSDPTSTLSAITKGVNDIKTWQQEREAAANKLKTDTANSVRESTIEANKKLTGNKSVDTVILKALESTKNKLYTNEKLVQKNAKSPTDNLIFRQNAKQSYEILSQNLNDYDKNFQESLKRAKGYVGEDGNKIGGGAFEAGIQRVQTTLGNPNLYEIVSNDDGTMDISFYKTKINTTLNTRELVLDKEGNPIVDPTMSGMAATTFMKGKNQQSDRLYLSDEITKALAKGSALDTAYESIKTQEGYTGVVLDDMRNNPGIKKLLYDYAKNATATSERRLSILADNMPVGKEQIVLMPNDVENFKGDIKETVSYEYFDIDTGLVDKKTYNKYVIAKLDPMSGLFINEESDDAKLASERIALSSLYSGLKRKITGRDIDLSEEKEKDRKLRREENEKDRNFRRKENKKGDEVSGELIKKAVLGDSKSYEALLRKSGLRSNVLDDGRIQFVDQDNNKIGEPLKFSETTEDGKTTFLNARDTAIQLASILNRQNNGKGVGPEIFDNKIKFGKDQLVAEGGLIQFGEAPEVRLDLTTNIGTTKDKLSIQESLLEASQAASKEDIIGFNGSVLADGIQSTLGQALQKTNQNLNSSPKVTYDKKNETMTVTAVNSKGKTITISKSISDNIGKPDAIAKKANAFVTEFLSVINSSEDYIIGGSEKKVDTEEKVDTENKVDYGKK